MDPDSFRRIREEYLMQTSGPLCACGRRLWSRDPSRQAGNRCFRCRACLAEIHLPAGVFHNREAWPWPENLLPENWPD